MWISVQNRHSRILTRDLLRSRVWKMHREPEVLEAEAQVGKWLDCRARITSKKFAPWKKHPPECLFYKSENGCSFGEKCSYAHRQVDEPPSKRCKKNGDKSAVAMLKNTRQLGCVSQEMEPPKSTTILRKSSNILKAIRCVRFIEAVLRHANIRDQNPSLGMICPGDPHQRNPNAPNSEDRSQEETEWQERCVREAAWKLAKNIVKFKEKHKTGFSSPSEYRCLLAPPTLKPEERQFVVDSGASMHMISNKDLNSAELETVTTSRSPTTLITATGDVLEDTPAVSSLGKLCDEHEYSYEWINGEEPHLMKNGIRIQCNTENFVPFVVPGLSTSSSSSLLSSTSMTLSRQEIDHPKSSSSSSTSPPTTPSKEIDNSDHPPAIVSGERVERQERRDPYFSETSEELLTKPAKHPKSNKNEDRERVLGDPCHSDIPEWLQEIRENLVDDRVPERRDSHASSSHGLSLEPTRSVDLGKHCVYTHFPKDRNFDVCQRTKITRAPCRRRSGWVVLRAENLGTWLQQITKFSVKVVWISKQSPICSRGARLGYPRDAVVSVQNTNFSGNTKELATVLGAE